MNCKYCRANCTGAKHDREIALCLGYDPPKTNGDKFRAMTDEELAEWFVIIAERQLNHVRMRLPTEEEKVEARKAWLEWLKQAAEDGEA